MGIFSRLGFRGPKRRLREPVNLVRYEYDDPKLEQLRRDVAEDVARVEEDDKYFGRDKDTSPDMW
jgi:hypothetical protein